LWLSYSTYERFVYVADWLLNIYVYIYIHIFEQIHFISFGLVTKLYTWRGGLKSKKHQRRKLYYAIISDKVRHSWSTDTRVVNNIYIDVECTYNIYLI